MDIELKFGFGVDYEQIKSIVENSIHANSDLLQDPAYKIGVSTVDPDGYKVMINVWVNAHSFQELKMQFQKELVMDLKSSGVKLPGT
jgi:small conductance mechanosensitive channel